MSKLSVVAVTLLVACSPDNSGLERKIDALSNRINVLEARVGTGAGKQQPQRPRRPEPDPKDVYGVSVAGLPSVGPADAPVTIVEGYEYACPACQTARQSVTQTLAKYGAKVRVVYKPFIVHPDTATDASIAACAANEQGKFAAMDPLIWDKAFGARDFSAAKLETIAAEAGLDVDRYKKDLPACRQTVAKHHTELAGFGQGATPTFFINGRYIVGANPARLHAVIDEELALAEERIKAGTKPADYYATWVVGKGLKRFEPKS
jgi:protein-disulfide isomerase